MLMNARARNTYHTETKDIIMRQMRLSSLDFWRYKHARIIYINLNKYIW